MVSQFGIAKLLPVTPISLWFMVDISIVTMVYKPTYNWGVLPCRVVQMDSPYLVEWLMTLAILLGLPHHAIGFYDWTWNLNQPSWGFFMGHTYVYIYT